VNDFVSEAAPSLRWPDAPRSGIRERRSQVDVPVVALVVVTVMNAGPEAFVNVRA